MDILLLSRDLMLFSRTQGATTNVGLSLQSVPDFEAARASLQTNCVKAVIIDLRVPELEIADLVTRFRSAASNNVFIVACGPHVHEQSLAAAREAGCDVVVTRGQFERDAESVLRRCVTRTP